MNIFVASLVFYPMLGALISYLIGKKSKKVRDVFACVLVVTEFIAVIACSVNAFNYARIISMVSNSVIPGESLIARYAYVLDFKYMLPEICGLGLNFSVDGFRIVYALIVAFMWMMTTLLSPEYFAKYRNRNRFYTFLLLTEGATMGVFLSSDFYTTFIFFEIMSLTSYVWVVHDEKKASLRAGETYLGISVLGGLVMLMGIFMLYAATGTVAFNEIPSAIKALMVDGNMPATIIAAGICMIFGFAVKAGAFPVHIWLPKAHPVAPAPASALLSGVLTKTGIFGITVITLKIFAEVDAFGYVLVAIAVATMLLGAVMAIFSTNLKKVLACSSLSQIGFILTGIACLAISGGESELAARGAFIYMVNHSILKLVLFMSAGVIFMNLHKLELEDIKGFGRKKPLLNIIFALGVVGIAGVPFFNGYVGKTLIHEAIVEVHGVPGYVEPCFLLAGGFTLAYMLKLYICIFWEKNNNLELQAKFDGMKKYMNIASGFALIGSVVIIPIIGIVPNITADAIMDIGQRFYGIVGEEKLHYFAFHNMKGSLISIAIGLTLYFVLARWLLRGKDANGKKCYKDYWPAWLDLENVVYRPVLIKFIPFISGIICRVLDSLVDGFVVLLRKTIYVERKLPYERPEGNMITHYYAVVVGFIVKILNATFLRNKPVNVDFEHKFALINMAGRENGKMLERTLSYGLLLFCIGLVITVTYLLLVVFL
ncbi:MAG: sodium:proton antiporter [Lachnospiraceae bacterium]|nr:sodium:proton antiporter [Lachnospiraceae bacterium]